MLSIYFNNNIKTTKCPTNCFKDYKLGFLFYLIVFHVLNKSVMSLTMLHQQQQQEKQQEKQIQQTKFRLKLEDVVNNPQPCPDNPIRLLAQKTLQYIYSPYDENKNYPPDTDCQFLIEATDKFHRIHLTIIESDLEEPLFTDCNDYVSVRDREGNETNVKEVARWCGQDYPAAIASASDSLLVHFHSDSIIQKRGFNISFMQYDIDTCPTDWISDGLSSPYCYKQFVLPHILPWFEAQKECSYERANLATFQNEADYAFIVESFSQTHSFPWIGYSDANVEGIYESIDKNIPLWPENFPLKHENEMKDCVYLDWNKRDQQVVYEIDDCRNRRPFLCKKRRDGTEIPVVLPTGMIRRGFRDFTIDYTLLIVVIVLALLALIVGCILYHKYKERNNRIINIDMNQRLVQQQNNQSKKEQKPITGALAKQKIKEKERRELREQKYSENNNNNNKVGNLTTKSPFESQESNASFTLQTFQPSFSQRIPPSFQVLEEPIKAIETTTTTVITSQQMREHEATKLHSQQASGDTVIIDSPPDDELNFSPRIRLSPNQPPFSDEKRKISDKKIRKGWMGDGTERTTDKEEEEEEPDRHNMGYEPDSEEEEGEREQFKNGRRASQINEDENFLIDFEEEKRGEPKNSLNENIEEKELEEYLQHNQLDSTQTNLEGEQFSQYKHKNVLELNINNKDIENIEQQVELNENKNEKILEGSSNFREEEKLPEKENNIKDIKVVDNYVIGDHFKAAQVVTSVIASAAIAATEHPIRPPIELMRVTTRTTSSSDKTTEIVKSPPIKESEKIEARKSSLETSSKEGKEESEAKETFPEKVSGKFTKAEGEGTEGGGTRIRIRRKTFDRPPPTGPLDNASAISLDEFWQQQK